MKVIIYTLIIVLFILVSCSSETSTPVFTESSSPIPTFIPPILSQLENTQVLSATNIQQIQNLATFGYGYITNAIYSPDGSTLAVSTTIGIWLYDLTKFYNPPLFLGESSLMAVDLAYNSDGRYLAVGYSDKIVRVWDVQTGELHQTLTGHFHNITSVAYSPDNRYIAAGSSYNSIIIWYAETGIKLREISHQYEFSIYSLDFSPDSQYIVATSDFTRVWNVEFGGLYLDYSVATKAIYSPNGQFIATSRGRDGEINIWDTTANDKIYTTLDGYSDGVRSIDYSPDGRFLVASYGKDIQIWDTYSRYVSLTIKGHNSNIYRVLYSPDGRFITTVSSYGDIKIWNSQNGELQASIINHTSAIDEIEFSPDNKFIAVADGNVRVWNMQTGTVQDILWQNNDARSVSYNTDGSRIVSTNDIAYVWDSQTSEMISTFQESFSNFTNATYSPDNRFIVTGTWDGKLKLWDAQTYELKVEMLEYGYSGSCIAYSPDSRFIASGFDRTYIYIWSSGGGIFKTLSGHNDFVSCVDFSSDGLLLVSSSWDGSIKIWDAKRGGLIHDLQAHTDGTNTVALNTNGDLLVSGGKDNLVKIWNPQTGELYLQLEEHTANVTSVTFSADGRFIASAGWDGIIRIWGVPNR